MRGLVSLINQVIHSPYFCTPMKKILCLAFAFSTFLVSAQDDINQKDSQGRKHGTWKKNHENGKLRYVGTFDHGKEVGTFRFYFDDGDIRAINKFRGNTGICYSYQFGSDSVLAAEGKYIDSKRDSIWTFYDIDGNVVARESFKNDVRNGLSETYYPNGRVAESVTYKNGKKIGEWKQFYDNGRPKAKGTYVNGSLQGEVIYYALTGKPRAKGNYLKGLMHGNWYYFNDNMKVDRTEVWKYGTMMSQDPPVEKEEDEVGIEPVDEGNMKWQK